MQNGRLQELENMLSQTTINSVAIVAPAAISQPPEEFHELKEEVCILNEAMEVQVDEYERKIRTLKDPQRGKSKRGGPAASRKSVTLEIDFSLSALGGG